MAGALPMTADEGSADGLLLFAHGARDPRWSAPFEAVAERCRAQRPGLPVQLAFLEFMAPDMGAGGQALVDQGCRCVHVVPLFLGAGGHVRKDVPGLLAGLRERHPGVRFELAATIGEAPQVIDAMARTALSAITP